MNGSQNEEHGWSGGFIKAIKSLLRWFWNENESLNEGLCLHKTLLLVGCKSQVLSLSPTVIGIVQT